MEDDLIHLDDVTYWYPEVSSPALRHVGWHPASGMTAIAGDSGSGKSTLLRVLNGLVPHFHGGRIRGQVGVGGFDVLRTPTRRLAHHVGFVFQDPEMQSVAATVERDVAFGLANLAVPTAAMRARITDALAQVGLEGFENRRVRTLSGGERQRVALAATLALHARVVALDEPLSQLDRDGATALVEACVELAGRGTTIIIAEHRWNELPANVGVTQLRDGAITGFCTVADMRSDSNVGGRLRGDQGDVAWTFEGVTLTAGPTELLAGITLSGSRGSIVAFVGANGSGKTTLLRALAGLHKAVSGRVHTRGRIAYLPQNPALLLHRDTIRDEVSTTLLRCGSREPANYWLNAFGLMAVAERFPRDLSSGQRQRAAIATVLAARPDILLLDEPTRGMDGQARDELIRAVTGLADSGTAVVIATHDTNLTSALGAQCVELGEGSARPLRALELVIA